MMLSLVAAAIALSLALLLMLLEQSSLGSMEAFIGFVYLLALNFPVKAIAIDLVTVNMLNGD